MNVLREKMTFLIDEFVPTSVECIYCNCKCPGSVYSLELDNKDICIYLHEPTYSILSYVILKDSYVNYNHFLLARVFGIDIGFGKIYEIIEEIKNYVNSENIESKEMDKYKKLISDYDTAISIPSEKIKQLKNKYNVEEEELYISTIQNFDKNFDFLLNEENTTLI